MAADDAKVRRDSAGEEGESASRRADKKRMAKSLSPWHGAGPDRRPEEEGPDGGEGRQRKEKPAQCAEGSGSEFGAARTDASKTEELVDGEGKLLNKLSIKTLAERSMEEIIHDMGKLASDAIKDAGLEVKDIECIGIGSPGTPDNEEGLLVYSSNLPFNKAPMRKLRRTPRLFKQPSFQ